MLAAVAEPTVGARERLAARVGAPPDRLPVRVTDWDALVARSKAAKARPAAWLEMTAVYGDLGQDARFASAFERHLNRLWAVGTKQTLTEFLA